VYGYIFHPASRAIGHAARRAATPRNSSDARRSRGHRYMGHIYIERGEGADFCAPNRVRRPIDRSCRPPVCRPKEEKTA